MSNDWSGDEREGWGKLRPDPGERAGLFVPVELYHLWHRFTWLKLAVLGVNLAVVAVMVFALRHRAEQERELADRSAKV